MFGQRGVGAGGEVSNVTEGLGLVSKDKCSCQTFRFCELLNISWPSFEVESAFAGSHQRVSASQSPNWSILDCFLAVP